MKERVLQIAAGFSHSIVMLESTRELQWFGTCGHSNNQSIFKPSNVHLHEHLPDFFPEANGSNLTGGQVQAEFAVIKLFSSWSRSMSLTSVLIADLRQINSQNPWKKVSQSVQVISQKWEPRTVLPPYIESVAQYFNTAMVKIPG